MTCIALLTLVTRYARMLCVSSVHRQPGKPFWFCAFYDYDAEGQPVRRFRSTRTTNRKQAERVCAAMERAAKVMEILNEIKAEGEGTK